MQWGASEDDFINKFGSPNGYLRLDAAETGMIYGRNHAFLFTASKLSGVRISTTLLDRRLTQALLTRTPFDDIRWRLSNGIRRQMNLAEVKRIVGDNLRTESRFQRYFNTDKARVEFDFVHQPVEDEKDEAYSVYGLYIRQVTLRPPGLVRKAAVSAKPIQSPPQFEARQNRWRKHSP